MYSISNGKIRIIRVRKKWLYSTLKYVWLSLSFINTFNKISIPYKMSLSPVFKYMAKEAVDCRNMVRVKVWHTHTTVWLLKNYSQRILMYNTRILLLDLTYGRTMPWWMTASSQRWNRVSGAYGPRVIGSPGQRFWPGQVGSRVRVSDPVFDSVLSFNMRVYCGFVSTE